MEINGNTMHNLGLILLLVGLALAWVLVLCRYILQVDESKISTRNLLSAHLDYLAMGVILIVFSIIDKGSPDWLILLTCIGTIVNPAMFVVKAFKPDVSTSPFSWFGILTTLSFIVITIGLGGLCVLNMNW